MLYDLLIIFMIPVVALLVFFSYRQGLKDGKAIKNDLPLKPVIEKSSSKKIMQSKEMQRLNKILENVNNYQGSGVGQQDIKL